MKNHWILILCLLAVHVGCRNPTKPNANGGPPGVRDISRNSGNSCVPSIAVDASENVHVVWHDSTPGNWEVLYAVKSQVGDWSQPTNVSNTATPSVFSTITVDASGTVHVVWEEKLAPNQIFYAAKANDQGWSTRENISQSAEFSALPVIGVDGLQNLHVVWMEVDLVYTTKPSGGSWSPPTQMPTGGFNPAIAVEPNANVHVVCEAEADLEILYIGKLDGEAWSAPINISNMPGYSRLPEVAVDSHGNIYATWDEAWEGVLYYAVKFPDSSFSLPIQIEKTTGSPSHSPHCIDIDSAFHLVWDEAENGKIYYAKESSDSSWSNPISISDGSPLSYNPSLALGSSGNIHVVWQGDDFGNYDIFYRIVP